jgi:transposase
MGPKVRANTTPETRAAMVALVNVAGKSRSEVARLYHVNWHTVDDAIRRSHLTGSCKDRFRSGRPKVTTKHTDQAIKIMALRNRKLTAPALRGQLSIAKREYY